MKFGAFLLLLIWASASPAFADKPFFGTIASGGPYFSDPQPSFDHPRRIVLSLSESDPARVDEVISNVANIQRFYGADNVRIALVAYGPGIRAVLRDRNSAKEQIEGLLAIGIDILACKETLDTIHRTAGDLIKGVEVVPNGLPEIVELQVRGWTYVRP